MSIRLPPLLLLLLVGLLGACLNRENVGTFDAACPDNPSQATESDRETCISAFIADLSTGRWIGPAKSGATSALCVAEFASDGNIFLAPINEADRKLFGDLFPEFPNLPGTPVRDVEGSYLIDDLLNGEFFGTVDRPVGESILRNDLAHMLLDGDVLEFDWRANSDISFITTHLVLTRQR